VPRRKLHFGFDIVKRKNSWAKIWRRRNLCKILSGFLKDNVDLGAWQRENRGAPAMREVYSEAARFGGPERGLFGLLSSELSGRNP
jgi:hypothetical protein